MTGAGGRVFPETSAFGGLRAVNHASADARVRHPELRIQDHEIRKRPRGDDAEAMQLKGSRGGGGTHRGGVDYADTDVFDEDPERLVHREHAACNRAVVEIRDVADGNGTAAKGS